jgi:hypothetical protein
VTVISVKPPESVVAEEASVASVAVANRAKPVSDKRLDHAIDFQRADRHRWRAARAATLAQGDRDPDTISMDCMRPLLPFLIVKSTLQGPYQ